VLLNRNIPETRLKCIDISESSLNCQLTRLGPKLDTGNKLGINHRTVHEIGTELYIEAKQASTVNYTRTRNRTKI